MGVCALARKGDDFSRQVPCCVSGGGTITPPVSNRASHAPAWSVGQTVRRRRLRLARRRRRRRHDSVFGKPWQRKRSECSMLPKVIELTHPSCCLSSLKNRNQSVLKTCALESCPNLIFPNSKSVDQEQRCDHRVGKELNSGLVADFTFSNENTWLQIFPPKVGSKDVWNLDALLWPFDCDVTLWAWHGQFFGSGPAYLRM